MAEPRGSAMVNHVVQPRGRTMVYCQFNHKVNHGSTTWFTIPKKPWSNHGFSTMVEPWFFLGRVGLSFYRLGQMYATDRRQVALPLLLIPCYFVF